VAETFKNARRSLTTSVTDVYVVPSGTTAIVIGCQVVNTGSAVYNLTLSWLDASESNAETYLSQAIPVPDAAAYEPIGGRLVLEAGDRIRGFGSSSAVLDVTLSVLEIS
jgi:hypothetical protein